MEPSKHTTANDPFRERIKATQSRLLDVVEAIVDGMAPKAPPAAAIAVARRQFANTVRLWMFCDLSRCRRSQCCRGEPLNCLRMGMTLLPPEAFEHLMQRGKGRAKRERQKSAAQLSAAP